MKKLILALLFLLLSCPVSFAENQQLAWMGPVIVGAVTPVASSCSTSNDSSLYDVTATEGAEGSIEYAYIASKITLGSSTTVTEYSAIIKTDGGPRNWTMSLYSHDSENDRPDAEISGTSKTISDNTASFHEAVFTLDTPKTNVNAGTYWLVIFNPDQVGSRVQRVELTSGDRYCYDSASNFDTPATCSAYYNARVSLRGCQ